LGAAPSMNLISMNQLPDNRILAREPPGGSSGRVSFRGYGSGTAFWYEGFGTTSDWERHSVSEGSYVIDRE